MEENLIFGTGAGYNYGFSWDLGARHYCEGSGRQAAGPVVLEGVAENAAAQVND